MKTLKYFELLEKTKDGKIFSLTYLRADKSMGADKFRFGVKSYLKGGALNYDPIKAKNLVLFNMSKKQYRTIKFERIISAKIDGVEYTFFNDTFADSMERIDKAIENINKLNKIINR
ncbi:MAG: hypothetical protein GOVbin40013_3 [Prokaryotic dsDNA virus sp.]|jgi:hypothetical protein|nr:MAG: hypothetical protein GOVbin40013_3 [Prokaryotic dsDNA virus sp.]|tara:strand:+ start:3470 stop:3820 length:351 start_codon:yes stop_codon:yes gene_type:complete